MAIANFFDKVTLAASQVLQGVSAEGLERRLNTVAVCLAVGSDQPLTHEVEVCAELTVSLLARFYPKIALALPEGYEPLLERLRAVMTGINPGIEFVEAASASYVLAIGAARPCESATCLNIGSDGWIAKISNRGPVHCGSSKVPFGAAAAACLGAANLFRLVFSPELPNTGIDGGCNLSMLDYQREGQSVMFLEKGDIDIGDIHLVGIGAVGCAAVWTLSKYDCLKGGFHLIDPEEVSLSNLQRYVLCSQTDVQQKRKKVDVAIQALKGNRGLRVKGYPTAWGTYLKQRNDWNIELVVAAVDSANVRREIQAALPRQVINAWTGANGDAGLSRHFTFGQSACLMCLYMPEIGGKNFDQIVAESLGLNHPQQLIGVRKMLHTGEPLTVDTVRQIATLNNVAESELASFVGKPLAVFYNEAICGGIMLRLKEGSVTPIEVEVPLAFQSAMAGVMLAAELVSRAAKLAAISEATTRLSLLRPIGDTLSFNFARDASGKCICHDPDFVAQYDGKYPS